jgi:hypothetical protein
VDHAPYFIETALITSQLIPPILIQRTFTHDSRALAAGSFMSSTNSRFVMRPKLLRTAE